jgi:hypothetical protein
MKEDPMAKGRPDGWDVLIAGGLIVTGVPLAMTLLFAFIGVPMIMIGVELLMPQRQG